MNKEDKRKVDISLVKIERNGKYGLFNLDKSLEVCEPKYDEIYISDDYFLNNGVMKVKVNNLFGLCDVDGKIVFKPIAKDIIHVHKNIFKYSIVDRSGFKTWGLINQFGNLIIEAKFTDISNLIVLDNSINSVTPLNNIKTQSNSFSIKQ